MKFLTISIALVFSPLAHCQEFSLLWAPSIQTTSTPQFKLDGFQLLGFGFIAGGDNWAKFIAKAHFLNGGVDKASISKVVTADNLIGNGILGSEFAGTANIYSVGLLADLEPNLFITGGLSYIEWQKYMKYGANWYEFKRNQSNIPITDRLSYFAGFGIRIQRFRFLFTYEGKAQSITTGLAFKF